MRRISFILMLAAAVWAAPREHRGTYFSVGSGVAYSRFKTAESYDGYRYIDGVPQYGDVDGTITFGGVSPAFNMRIGRSVGNAVSIYGDFDFVMISGKFESSTELLYRESYQVEEKFSRTLSWNGVVGGYFSGGVGIEVYPCRNPNSVMRGFHFGNAFSAGYNVADPHKPISLEDVSSHEKKFDEIAFLVRTDVGMDWWVSETWSIGVEFAYTTASHESGILSDMNSFRLLFRITRG